MSEINKILYYYDKDAHIVYKRRILLLKNQLENVLIEELVVGNYIQADILIVLILPKNENLIRDILNRKYSKWIVYDRTNDLRSIIKPSFLREVVWGALSLLKNKKHRSFVHRDFIRKSDLVITGSRLQAESVKIINQNCYHIVDSITTQEYPLLKEQLEKKTNDIPIVVWEGTHTSMHQIATILPSLLHLQKQNTFKLIILSNIRNRKDEEFIKWLTHNGLIFQFVEWTIDDFKNILLTADIAIAPIDVSKRFNRAKPFNKILTYWAYKLPVVVSDIESYREVIIQGKNGFICSTEKQWVDTLQKLINDNLLVREAGEQGFREIKNYTELSFAKKYLAILDENLK